MKLQELANKLNFTELNNCFYQTYGQITGSLIEVDFNINCPAVSFYYDKPFTKDELKEIKKHSSKNVVYHNKFANGVLLILTLPLGISLSDKYVEKCRGVIDTFVSFLASKEYITSNKCIICGEESSYNSYGLLYLPVHEECKNTVKEVAQKSVEEENKNVSNLPKSIILAFIGAVVGLIPSVISIFGFGMMYALLYALIPLCSFFGYKLGKAPKRWYATAIVVGLSVIVAVGLDVSLYNLIAAAEGISLAEYIALYSADFIRDILMSVLFIALGVWFSWKYISNTADNRNKEASKL